MLCRFIFAENDPVLLSALCYTFYISNISLGKGGIFLPEGTFVTITGFKNDYDKIPFAIGAKFLCAKEPGNPYDTGPSCPCPKWPYRRIYRQQRAYQDQRDDVSRPRV